MLIRLTDIQVKKRIRKEIGNINELTESIKLHGLMNPIVINKEKELIAGYRRLAAARKLGWNKIEATVVDAPGKISKLELEIEENIYRKDFTADEIVDAYSKLEKLKKPGILRKIFRSIRVFFQKLFGKGIK